MLTGFFGYVSPALVFITVLSLTVAEHGLNTVGDWIGLAVLALFFGIATCGVWYITWTRPKLENIAWWE